MNDIFGPPAPKEQIADGDFDFVEKAHSRFPPIVIVAVTNVCDMACIHCAHPIVKKQDGYQSGFLPPELHSKLIREVARYTDNLWVLRYAADGESLLHPQFIAMVEEAKQAGIAPVNLTTNAMALTEHRTRRLLEAEIDVIDVSLDALHQQTYEQIRKRGNFERVTANLHRLLDLRDSLGSKTKIMVSIIKQKEALGEVEDFQQYWVSRVDEVLVRGLNSDLGIVDVSETYFDDQLIRWPCPQFWKRVTINHLGQVRFCVEDWFNRGIVGHLGEHSIAEIWQGPLYERFRELHVSGRWSEMTMCAGCQDWQHMEWNHGFEKAVNKVLGKNPPNNQDS